MKYASNRCNSELLKKKKKCLFNILHQSQQLNPTENVKGTAAYTRNDCLPKGSVLHGTLTTLFGGNVWPTRRALHEGIQSKHDLLSAGTLGLAKHTCKQIRAACVNKCCHCDTSNSLWNCLPRLYPIGMPDYYPMGSGRGASVGRHRTVRISIDMASPRASQVYPKHCTLGTWAPEVWETLYYVWPWQGQLQREERMEKSLIMRDLVEHLGNIFGNVKANDNHQSIYY